MEFFGLLVAMGHHLDVDLLNMCRLLLAFFQNERGTPEWDYSPVRNYMIDHVPYTEYETTHAANSRKQYSLELIGLTFTEVAIYMQGLGLESLPVPTPYAGMLDDEFSNRLLRGKHCVNKRLYC